MTAGVLVIASLHCCDVSFELVFFKGCGVFKAGEGLVKAVLAAQEKANDCSFSLQKSASNQLTRLLYFSYLSVPS